MLELALYLISNLISQIDTEQMTILFAHFIPIAVILFVPPEESATIWHTTLLKVSVSGNMSKTVMV